MEVRVSDSAARTLPVYRLNLTPDEATKGRRILTRLNDWLATDARYVVVPQEVLDALGGLLAECFRAEREGVDDAAK
jgi:hypothetical protein